jgi:hypothetical protein
VEATCSSETSVDYQRTTRYYVLEHTTLLCLYVSVYFDHYVLRVKSGSYNILIDGSKNRPKLSVYDGCKLTFVEYIVRHNKLSDPERLYKLSF